MLVRSVKWLRRVELSGKANQLLMYLYSSLARCFSCPHVHWKFPGFNLSFALLVSIDVRVFDARQFSRFALDTAVSYPPWSWNAVPLLFFHPP